MHVSTYYLCLPITLFLDNRKNVLALEIPKARKKSLEVLIFFFGNSMLRFNCTHSNKTGVYLTAITGSSYPFSKLPEDDYWAPHMQAFQSGVEKHPRKERTSKLD